MDILEKSKEQLDELNEKHWSECQMIANYDNELKEYMQNSEIGCCEGFKVSWKQQSRTSFDLKAFSADHPEIDLSAYYKTSSSRIFRIKEE